MSDVFVATVRDFSAKGLGIVDAPDGRVVFVHGAVPGDSVEVEVYRWEKRFGFATLKSLVKPSLMRQENIPCKFQGASSQHCHGCPWMPLRYEDQLRYKQNFVINQLERAKLLAGDSTHSTETIVKSIIGSANVFSYRNRAQFKTDGSKLGFVSSHYLELVDVDHCAVLTTGTQKKLDELRANLPNPSWTPVGNYNWNFFDVDDETHAQPAMNKRLGFRQGNDLQNAYMQSWLVNSLESCGDNFHEEEALELFCGSGNFTTLIAPKFKHVLAVEAEEFALQKLRERPGTANVKTVAIDLLRKRILEEFKKQNIKPSLLFLDPPRSGFKQLFEMVEYYKNSLKNILYVSCDVVSFARDVSLLAERGWRLKSVQPVDLFPHTPHVEILCEIIRQ